ncbi:hypothetical protein FFK22_024700 [Mycobacterium sp. KBS0706]|uniref:hypothetical protein n=1 Tax=Mycobacterium sp. KBS0706 TaxID=2578109 RepID=UPI00110FAD62|nr:hypothetical protein [Mycobacterium sp. KBS0706]TSD86022.1 hypothetical protein FFK22_024700 [Mycobacterium sp. KBS0706]
MTWILDENPTFKHSVKAQKPIDGGFETVSFDATFRLLGHDELAQYDTATIAGTTQFLQAVVVGLGGIVGGDKQPIPYSDALRDRAINIPYARSALINAYFDGAKGGKLGN